MTDRSICHTGSELDWRGQLKDKSELPYLEVRGRIPRKTGQADPACQLVCAHPIHGVLVTVIDIPNTVHNPWRCIGLVTAHWVCRCRPKRSVMRDNGVNAHTNADRWLFKGEEGPCCNELVYQVGGGGP